MNEIYIDRMNMKMTEKMTEQRFERPRTTSFHLVRGYISRGFHSINVNLHGFAGIFLHQR